MRMWIQITFIFLSATTFAQGKVGYLLEEMPLDTVQVMAIENHTSLRPFIRQGVFEESKIGLHFLSDINYNQSKSAGYKAGLGAELDGVYSNKWYFRLAAVQGISDGDSLWEPKSFLYQSDSNTTLYTDIRSRISYTPNHIFNFQAGLDHNFIGEGSRSLFLSDYGKPYPFGMIRSRFWRVEYAILYQFMNEMNGNKWNGKFISSHHVSFNASKAINFGIFESVIFQPKDTLLQRGFDVEYLNPMIFFRPQEYSLGSSDNVLLGADLTVKIKEHTIYGQFLLDEFFLSEIKAKSGWWANKFGGQVGIKGRFNFMNQHFFYRTEFNFSRPYTYSHLSENFNYGNLGNPLAHPLGANFMEILGELKWQKDKWTSKLFLNYYLSGRDKDGFNYGTDIYLPYTFRPGDYGHYIGQGQGFNVFHLMLSGSYRVSNHGNLQAFMENHLKYNTIGESFQYSFVIGLRSILWNDYRNY